MISLEKVPVQQRTKQNGSFGLKAYFESGDNQNDHQSADRERRAVRKSEAVDISGVIVIWVSLH